MDEGRTHARAMPLLSSSLPSAPGWGSPDLADVAANVMIRISRGVIRCQRPWPGGSQGSPFGEQAADRRHRHCLIVA
jgi:hypothetical protein